MKLTGYRLGIKLGHGEHTAVYRALREEDGLPVVIKTLSREYPLPAEVRRLEFEFRMLDTLRGPHVIEVLGLARTGGQLALVLEDFEARSLAETLPLALGDFFRVARQVALGLGHVHGKDVIHKDIKPHNLLANADFTRVKLTDFQLAAEVSRERQDVNVQNHLEGSLPYISPEQTGRMNRALDYRSDYYSLGVTFFELLVGSLPFSATDVMGWVHCHISKAPPEVIELVPSVPVMLSRLVAKLMAKEPRERYQSARCLLTDLERCELLSREGRGAETFTLGEHDVSERFALSQQLVGRQEELRTLTGILEDACGGPGKLLAVSGHSGVGKSSLIREVHKPVALRRGYFAQGKYDQLERSVPYAGLVEALSNLVRQLLAEPEAMVQAWRQRILGSLGAAASVMAELVPELESLIGPQTAPPPLEPGAAKNRFKLAFARFIEAIASAEHPLVLFIDDMQWADASTPDLLVDLLISHDLHHLLVVCAYRDNEVSGKAHLLTLALQRLRDAAPHRLLTLPLAPLTERAVEQMVAGALKCTPADGAPLAHEIYQKTEGNPFFARELLTALYRRGAVAFKASAGCWVWDLEAARALTASQNVVELLLGRLEHLPQGSLLALQTAACIGNVFTLSTLSSLIDRSPDATALLLSEALAEGLVVPLDDNYKLMQLDADDRSPNAALDVRYMFQHDRVQQAAYSLIADSDKAATHLRIGRGLLATERDAEKPDDIFSPTNHLNVGRSLMTSVAERESLAKLNRKAGAKAQAATAFAVAARYHEAGVSALTLEEWSERPELRFALFSERVGSVLMAGERERAARLCDDLFALAPTQAARAAVHLMRSQVALHQGQMLQAIESVRQGLSLLGITYPSDPAAIDQGIGEGIGKMQAHLARVPIDDLLHLPECTDAEKIVALQLLFHVVAPAIMVYPPLFILAELLTFDLALTHGTTAVCAKNFVDCGMIQGAALGDYATAYRLGKVAFRVLERYDARALAGQVYFVFAAYVSPWGAPYAEALHCFEESRRLDIETGDHQHLAFSEALHVRILLLLGRHLDECDTAARATATLFERIQVKVQVNAVRLCQLPIDQLRASDDAIATNGDGQRLTDDLIASGVVQHMFQHGQLQMLVSVLLGDWESANRWWELTRARQMAASTLFIVPEYHLLECLITTQHCWPQASEVERPALLAALEQKLTKLRGWTHGCPENFSHKYLLAAAEVARIKDEPAGAVVALYDQALEATGQQFLHLRALGSELFGRFMLQIERKRLAEPLLRDALELYIRWGAQAKVRRLEAQLDGWFPRSRAPRAALLATHIIRSASLPHLGLRPQALDLTGVLEANRAISGELESERLFAALMAAILKNAAAQRGCLVLCDADDRQLYVRARADQRSSDADVSVHHRLDDEPRVCHQMVRFVARSEQALVIDDAGSHPTFARDAYVIEHAIKSVLCMPIVNQGRLVAVLYVENNAMTHAFTGDRVETLRLIAGQAAISITNASLYEGLARKVAESAREIEVLAQIIDAGLEDFKSFCESSRGLLEQHLAGVACGLTPERRRALFRDVHTIEGHSRRLGLDPIVAAAHAAEECWALEAEPTPDRERAGVAALHALAEAIREYEQTGRRRLGRLWLGADARFKQALGAIESALDQTSERPSYPVRALTQVKQVVHRLNAVPLDQVLRDTSRMFPSLARELGKSVPEIVWVDDGTLLDAEWGRVLRDALLHTFRNSLDHGIETREEREALGKAPRGRIALFTVRDDHGVQLHLRDDGRGLPIAELRTKTGRLDGTDDAIAEAIFDYGVSTARQLSHTSGRGIGMDAVRGVLRERGGDVAIEFTGDTRAGYRPFELVFRLPSDATITP